MRKKHFIAIMVTVLNDAAFAAAKACATITEHEEQDLFQLECSRQCFDLYREQTAHCFSKSELNSVTNYSKLWFVLGNGEKLNYSKMKFASEP